MLISWCWRIGRFPSRGRMKLWCESNPAAFAPPIIRPSKAFASNVRFPLVPGHEPAGVVAAVGAHVRSVKEGDEVIVCPSGYCGYCRYCRMGQEHYCEHMYTTGGDGPDDVRPGQLRRVHGDGRQHAFAKPAGVSFDAACQTEPLSGAWKGIIHYSEMRVGDDVVIIGTGGIGMYCLMVAKAAGAGRLIAVDVSDHALETARQPGSDPHLESRSATM